MSQLLKYEYNEQTVEFDVSPDTLMVNATEMGKIFDKNVKDFLRNETTKAFLKECLKKENSPFLNIETVEDLFTSKQKSGTWMHRILALKFAAWLSPSFELWVYRTIDQILFGEFYRLKQELTQSLIRKSRIEELKEELTENELYEELVMLEKMERQSVYRKRKVIINQTSLFKNQLN